MNAWYKVSINGGEGFMLVTDDAFVGYYDATGQPMRAETPVYVIENGVAGPF